MAAKDRFVPLNPADFLCDKPGQGPPDPGTEQRQGPLRRIAPPPPPRSPRSRPPNYPPPPPQPDFSPPMPGFPMSPRFSPPGYPSPGSAMSASAATPTYTPPPFAPEFATPRFTPPSPNMEPQYSPPNYTPPPPPGSATTQRASSPPPPGSATTQRALSPPPIQSRKPSPRLTFPGPPSYPPPATPMPSPYSSEGSSFGSPQRLPPPATPMPSPYSSPESTLGSPQRLPPPLPRVPPVGSPRQFSPGPPPIPPRGSYPVSPESFSRSRRLSSVYDRPDSPAQSPTSPHADHSFGSDKVLSLSQYNFDDFISSKEKALIFFYDANQTRDEQLEMEFSKAADIRTDPAHGFGTVDCFYDQDLCGQHNIDKLPMFKLFSNGFELSSMHMTRAFNADQMHQLMKMTPVLTQPRAEYGREMQQRAAAQPSRAYQKRKFLSCI